MLRIAEMKEMSRRGAMWPEAARKPRGDGDRDLEVAEAEGLISRTHEGFVLTLAGRKKIEESR